MALSQFSVMWNNYFNEKSTDYVLTSVFKENSTPEVTRQWAFEYIKNTCCIRLSHALNSTAHKIPYIKDATLSGIKGKYIYRVSDMTKYLKNTYGPANVVKSGSPVDFLQAIAGIQGIICFNVSVWSDATGHYDLWDGSGIRYSQYFDVADSIMLWRVSE